MIAPLSKLLTCDVMASPIPIPSKKWLTLCEAMTALVYGNCLDRETILRGGLEFPSENQYRDKWKSVLADCLTEAGWNERNVDFLIFMNELNMHHSRQVFMKMHQCRRSWPPSINNLRRLWIQWIRARRAEERRERECGRLLLGAVMAGDVMLSGRLDGSAASRSENIRPDEIDTEYAVVWTINDLNPCNEKRHPIDFRQLWESVNVDRESLERWWAGLFYGTSDVARDSNRSKKGGAKSAAISMAIGAEFPNGIPSGIAAKERNARIQKRLILLGVSSPVSDEALAKGVQRYLQIDN